MSLCDHPTPGRWTPEEHQKFLLGLELFGKNWKKIQEIVKTRNGSQIRSHAQKHFLKLRKSGSYCEEPYSDHKSKVEDFSTPIQRSFTNLSDKQPSDHSYFMSIIVEYAKNHMNFDLWDAFIDDGTHKEAVTQIDSVPHQDSLQKEEFSKPQNGENIIIETTEH